MNLSTYTLTKLNIIKGDDLIDLSAAFIDFTIYESIFESFMTGHISLIDTFDLQNRFTLVGGETVEIEFFTIGFDDFPISFTGQIYKIDERVRVNEHAQAYIIYFCSNEMINNARKTVQRAYNQNKTNIVKAIFETHLKDSDKRFETVSSKGIGQYCFGSVRPTEAISCVLRNTISTTDDKGFLFYEDNKSFCCYPLEYLYKQEPVKRFEYSVANTYIDFENRAEEQFNRIQDFQNLEDNSFTDRILDGQLGSKNLFFDLKTKTFQTIKYDTDSFFRKDKSLASLSSKSDQNNRLYDDVYVIEYNTDSITTNRDLVLNKFKKQEIERIRYTIFVAGDSSLRAGVVCEVLLPRLATDIENFRDYVSGKFLITSIKHTCTNTAYYQDIMIQKDAYEDVT